MFPAMAIAARRAAALAAMHAATLFPPDRRRLARGAAPRAGAGAATRSAGEDIGLAGGAVLCALHGVFPFHSGGREASIVR